MVWLGHSSYFIQLDGQKILIDPVFSQYASPVFFVNKVFPGSSPFSTDDLPELDFLLITHDHWDHLDYPTVMALRSKTKKIVTGLGVGAHFDHWGFPSAMLHEADWNTHLQFGSLGIHVLPARHFSGRSLWDNKTLWVAFALTGSKHCIFLSGDSGYGAHFKEIGEAFDGFDIVSLDTGQYDPRYSIDTKGTIIFKLSDGGSIRDAGAEVHYSHDNDLAKQLATKLAQSRWGRSVSLEGNVLKASLFDPPQHQQTPVISGGLGR